MPATVASLRRTRLLAVSLGLVLLGSLIPLTTASAAVSLTSPATGGGAISADTATSGAFTTLTGPVITEDAAGQLVNAGTIIMTAPAGFIFNAGTGSVTAGGGGCLGLAASLVVVAATATATITSPSTAACVLTFSGLQVRPSLGTPLASGSIAKSGTTGPAGPYGTLTEVAGNPVLTFTSSPTGSTTSGVNLSPQPTVHDEDQFGNDRSGDAIGLTITPGTGTAGALLTCTTNPVNTNGTGDASFAGCKVDKSGTNYKLRASTSAGAGAIVDSAPMFNIVAGSANHLAFLQYPAVSSPALLSPQPVVGVVDLAGNVVTTDTRIITLTINQSPGTFNCSGGTSLAAVAGVANYSGCTQTIVANGYALTATSSPVITPITGAVFNVTSGPPSKLTLCWGPAVPCSATPPVTVTAAAAFPLQPTILIQDVAGNTVPNDNTTAVTLSILGGTPQTGGPGTLSCTGGSTKLAVNGVVSFSGCMIDKVGTGYRLLVTSSPVLTSTTSNVFNVVAGAPVKLGFVSEPGTSTAGSPFANTVAVAIQDAGGNVVTAGIIATVALSIGTNPGAGTLTCPGGNVAITVGGVATFAGCSINNQGVGYTLVAIATSTSPLTTLAPAVSSGFTVAAPPAVITITPSSSVITWGSNVLINVHFVNNGVGKAFTLQAARDGISWSTIATLTTDGASNASFSYRPANNLYYRAVFNGTLDLSPGTSPPTRIVVRQIGLLRPDNKGSIKTVDRGTNVTFTLTIRPSRVDLPTPKGTFRVYQLVGGHWNLIITRDVPAGAGGLAQLTVAFSSAGSYYVRAWALPTTFNANSVMSPIQRYNVR